jgi:hypothetical protein
VANVLVPIRPSIEDTTLGAIAILKVEVGLASATNWSQRLNTSHSVNWSIERRVAEHARLENAFQGHHINIAEVLGCNPCVWHLQAPSNAQP